MRKLSFLICLLLGVLAACAPAGAPRWLRPANRRRHHPRPGEDPGRRPPR